MGRGGAQDIANESGFRVGDNAPCDWRAATAYTFDRHGIEQDVRCLYLEVRNTLLLDPAELEKVARVVAGILSYPAAALPSTTAA